MPRRALCLGINRYATAFRRLRGCVNDARAWAELLREKFAFDEVRVLVDDEATREAIRRELGRLARLTQDEDQAAITFSGHGTWSPDEAPLDETDDRDEAWQAHDGELRDDAMQPLLAAFRPAARVFLISDSCHSGSVARGRRRTAAGGRRNGRGCLASPRGGRARAGRRPADPRRAPTCDHAPRKGLLLLSGCKDDELSYEMRRRGVPRGVLSVYAGDFMRAKPDQTWEDLINRLRRRLPSVRYPQTPQLTGDEELMRTPLFS